MKISIAMCTYNGALYLQEQLESIAAQTRLPDELVVCDDRSSDNTRGIIEAFASSSRFPVRLHVNEENLGSTKNFERAIGLCEGDIIALSDQDDVWHPEKLMRIETAFSSAPDAGVVFTDAEIVDEDLRPMGYGLWWHFGFGKAEQKLIREGKAFDVVSKQSIVTGATIAFRATFKELVLPVPDFTGFAIHDGWIALTIAAVANLVFIDEPLVKYRQHPQQQIGAGPPDVTLNKVRSNERLAMWAQPGFDPDLARLASLTTLYNRLSLYNGDLRYRDTVPQLEAIIAHLRARANNVAKPRLRRLPLVLRELLTLRYHRYSYGTRSTLKDLLGVVFFMNQMAKIHLVHAGWRRIIAWLRRHWGTPGDIQ